MHDSAEPEANESRDLQLGRRLFFRCDERSPKKPFRVTQAGAGFTREQLQARRAIGVAPVKDRIRERPRKEPRGGSEKASASCWKAARERGAEKLPATSDSATRSNRTSPICSPSRRVNSNPVENRTGGQRYHLPGRDCSSLSPAPSFREPTGKNTLRQLSPSAPPSPASLGPPRGQRNRGARSLGKSSRRKVLPVAGPRFVRNYCSRVNNRRDKRTPPATLEE